MRIIVFAGRGGSGTSTIAAATACQIAESSSRTLAFGLTPGIGAALDAKLSVQTTLITKELHAAEGHGGVSAEDEFRDWLQMLLDFRNMDADLGDDIAAMPGVNVVGLLLELEALVASEEYDAIVVDAGELRHFMDLPGALDAAARWLERLFAPRQQTVFEPFLRAFASDQIAAGEDVLDTGRDLLGRLANLRDLLTDPEVSSVRLVSTANRGAADALSEALALLGLFSYRVDAIVANRLLPDEVNAPFFDEARAMEQASLKAIRTLEPGPRVIEVELQKAGPVGAIALSAFAVKIYDGNSADFLSETDEHSVARDGNSYELRVFLPFAKRDELRLEETDEGIAVHLNGRRCVLSLPEDVTYSSAKAWAYEGRFSRVTLGR